MPKAKQISVDIVSDVVCPWCWVGKKRFDRAVAHVKGINVEIIWRPYMLDPNVPREGVPYREYMNAKFGDGPSDRFKAMRDHLEAAAPDLGITFRFSDIPTRPNTLDAHRLIRWAQGQRKGHKAKEALFRAFFDDLKDIGDHEVLSAIADDIGLDAKLVKDLLASDKDEAETLAEVQYFQQLGISGVPTFIFNGQFAVQGAQEVDVLVQALKQAAEAPPPPNN